MNSKTKLEEGDEVSFTLKNGKWQMIVRFAKATGGGMQGQIMPFNSFDEAVANLKQNHNVD
jgi:hypothetical protein